ncbi:MAG: hypothetical protein Q8S13_05925 [Dehalococcoidia bacterium]|nr:hypothetical protein [Dehalococcoidia bacterium]
MGWIGRQRARLAGRVRIAASALPPSAQPASPYRSPEAPAAPAPGPSLTDQVLAIMAAAGSGETMYVDRTQGTDGRRIRVWGGTVGDTLEGYGSTLEEALDQLMVATAKRARAALATHAAAAEAARARLAALARVGDGEP